LDQLKFGSKRIAYFGQGLSRVSRPLALRSSGRFYGDFLKLPFDTPAIYLRGLHPRS
jgi:hypothetical protein